MFPIFGNCSLWHFPSGAPPISAGFRLGRVPGTCVPQVPCNIAGKKRPSCMTCGKKLWDEHISTIFTLNALRCKDIDPVHFLNFCTVHEYQILFAAPTCRKYQEVDGFWLAPGPSRGLGQLPPCHSSMMGHAWPLARHGHLLAKAKAVRACKVPWPKPRPKFSR